MVAMVSPRSLPNRPLKSASGQRLHKAIESSPGHPTPDFSVLSAPADRTATDNKGTELLALRKDVEVDGGASLAEFQHSHVGLDQEFPLRFALCHLSFLTKGRTGVESGKSF